MAIWYLQRERLRCHGVIGQPHGHAALLADTVMTSLYILPASDFRGPYAAFLFSSSNVHREF